LFKSTNPLSTVGALELGGASTQNVYESEIALNESSDLMKPFIYDLRINGVNFKPLSYSLLCWGINEITLAYKILVIQVRLLNFNGFFS
jgi:hypothetical protein